MFLLGMITTYALVTGLMLWPWRLVVMGVDVRVRNNRANRIRMYPWNRGGTGERNARHEAQGTDRGRISPFRI